VEITLEIQICDVSLFQHLIGNLTESLWIEFPDLHHKYSFKKQGVVKYLAYLQLSEDY